MDRPGRQRGQQDDGRKHVHEEHEGQHDADVRLKFQRREYPRHHTNSERDARENDARAGDAQRSLVRVVDPPYP